MDVQRYTLHYWLTILSLLACSEKDTADRQENSQKTLWERRVDEGWQYLEDASFRRRALEESLVNPENGYSRARLAKYTEDKWGALPVWNPRVKKIAPGDIGDAPPKPDFTWETLDIPETWDELEMLSLGYRAFTSYPAQIEPSMREALADPDAPSRYGLWRTEDWIGGLLWVELPDGAVPALTCATCHASLNEEGRLVPGLPNYDFNLGKALDDYRRASTANSDWGPGRVDISPDGIFNPTVIADLRPVRYQTHLQRAATIVNSLPALAIRIETNIVSITGNAVRPPREAMLASALYLFELGAALPEPPPGPGMEVFEKSCASCHAPPSYAGDPVAVEDIGSNDAIARSPYRTTGAYKTPSLRGVSSRRMLTADGSIPSLESLLSKDRQSAGHLFGMDLSDTDRALLIDFLRAL